MRESERSPAAWATRRGPFDEMSGGDNFETKRQAQDFQVRQPPLKRAWPQPTPGITRHSEAIHKLGPDCLSYLFAELLAGHDLAERLGVYRELADPGIGPFIATCCSHKGGAA
jgi:hypothetical protein